MSTTPHPAAAGLTAFIARWDGTGMAERANYVRFLDELCEVLAVPRPDPASGSGGDYRYERSVVHHEADGSTSSRRIDLYRRNCFVLEAKQGSNPPAQTALFQLGEAERRANVRRSPGWAQAMLRAKGQAEGYARDLPSAEGWPPFVIVCDVGFCFDVYADFSGTGKHYAQFPDREHFRLYLPDLHRPEVRERLRAIWEDPLSLDPARQRVRVTRDIAALLARLARALEGPKERPRHAPQTVAVFLMRCMFCMFAQSVGLLPTRTAFTDLLEDCRGNLAGFAPLLGELWRRMNDGGFSTTLRAMVLRFNGGLFAAGLAKSRQQVGVAGKQLPQQRQQAVSSQHSWPATAGRPPPRRSSPHRRPASPAQWRWCIASFRFTTRRAAAIPGGLPPCSAALCGGYAHSDTASPFCQRRHTRDQPPDTAVRRRRVGHQATCRGGDRLGLFLFLARGRHPRSGGVSRPGAAGGQYRQLLRLHLPI